MRMVDSPSGPDGIGSGTRGLRNTAAAWDKGRACPQQGVLRVLSSNKGDSASTVCSTSADGIG
jgi:hypothetical protein